jgi:hypothetical protein
MGYGETSEDVSYIYLAQDTVQSRASVNTSANILAPEVSHLLTH